MHRYGYRVKGAVAAGIIAAAVAVGTSLAGASTSPSSPETLAPGAVAPAAIAGKAATGPQALSAKAARVMSLPAGTTQQCADPTSLNQMQCQVFIGHTRVAQATNRRPSTAHPAATVAGPLTPADLQAAYGLSAISGTAGTGQTVAVVDAFADPTIATDLRSYRSNNGLPACANASGVGTTAGCLTVLNQNGAASPLPSTTDLGWEDETALDVEMISAICPNCAIALFEANSPSVIDLGTAENSAAKVSKFVSNSWSGTDFPGESSQDNAFFNHPGVATAFASGDFGFGAEYPASSGLVTSVGGTYLTGASTTRGYSEVAWVGGSTQDGSGTGVGCSSGEGKPSWQADSGCANRTENDVSAVADAPQGVQILSSSGDCNNVGAVECTAFGTSVSTPIITAMFALAGTPEAATYPSSYLYQSGHAASLNDVTSGQVGSCESTRVYLCRAVTGYDGPTGWGTPNGVNAFKSTVTGHIVSIHNPGYYALQAGIKYTLPAIKAIDSAAAQTLTFSATGLPSGFSINSATGVISGTLSTTPANTTVFVKVTDEAGGSATVHFVISSVKSLLSSYHAGTGLIESAVGKCVNDTKNSTANGTPVDIYTCENVASETGWSYTPSGAPGLPNTVNIHGRCLYASGNPIRPGSKVGLYQCNGAVSEKWFLGGIAGEIIQASAGLCLNDPNGAVANNTQLTVTTCNGTKSQAFLMPASPITSGVAGKCIQYGGSGPVSTACSTSSLQKATLNFDGSIQLNGKCMYRTGSSFNNNTAVGFFTCNGAASEVWAITAYGQLENLQSEKCLAIPNNSATNGVRLVISDCYGQPGEVWAVS